MPINVRQILTLLMYTSKLASNSFKMARRQLVYPTRAAPPFHRMYTRKLTSLLLSMGLPLRNGELRNLSSLLRAPLRQRWLAQSGTDPWPRFETQACLLNS
jgi:hypothetical protein